MGFSQAIRPNLPSISPHYCSKFCSLRLNQKQKTLAFVTATKRKGNSLQIVRSVLNNRKSNISDNGATEPARVLLKRLFAETQKLEKWMSRESHFPEDVQIGINLEILESDLHAALTALRNREEDLQDAERGVLLEHNELNCAKEELERQEREIAISCSKHEKLEEELKQANLDLASQARQIEELKLWLKERDQEIAAMQSAFTLREDELDKMRNELATKSEEAARTNFELQHKARLLSEANEVVKKQEVEIQALQKTIQEKEQDLEVSVDLRKLDEEKLKVAESNLEKQTTEWLLAHEELKKLAGEASRHMGEANETLEDFRRVKKLLSNVRLELVSSQKYLVFSRQQMEEQAQSLEKQLKELEELRKSIMSYMKSLKDAQIEVETGRVKLRVAEARNKELEQDLSIEKELVEKLHEELKKEKSSLQQAIQEMSFLQEELEQKNNEFRKANNLLQDKESDLVEAKLEIQHLRSEQASLQLILEEKDLELCNARDKLEEVNQEVADLKMLMSSREDQLIQATTMLKEKDERVQMIQDELNGTKLKATDAETVVERIVELTSKLAISSKDEDCNALRLDHNMGVELMQQVLDKPPDDFRLQKKHLETELRFTIDNLRIKEMEVLASQRALTIKDEELKTVMERLDTKEQELERLKEEMIEDADDLRKLYALAQERKGKKSIGDLAIEKLQLEAAQLEVEAATSALQKLAEMSRELLIKASLSIEADTDTDIFPQNNSDSRMSMVEHIDCFTEVKTEVAMLSALTEQLVKDAGIVVAAD